jgi:hypothetical protein
MHSINLRTGGARSWLRGLLAVGLACACTMVSAAGWVAVLKNTAAEAFEEDDLRLFLDTAVKTLDSDGPRDTVDWSNAATGAGGSFRVVGDAAARDGMPCRRLRVSVYAPKYQKSTVTWTVCKSPEGRWRLASVG